MRVGEAFIIVYSICDKSSYDDISAYVEQLLRVKDYDTPEELVCIIVGHKVDNEVDRQVSTEEAREWALSKGFMFAEASAKDNINVQCVFENATAMALKYRLWSRMKQDRINKADKHKCNTM